MTVTIDGTAVINSVLLTEQGSPPSNPSAGLEKLYVTTNGLYLLNSSGGVIGPFITGTASTTTGRILINESFPTGTTTVTWNSIPGIYKSLQIELMGRTDVVSTVDNVSIYLNNDTTATNYWYQRLEVFDTSSNPNDDNGTAYMQIAGASAGAGSAGVGFARILDYAGTTFYKYIDAQSVSRRSATQGHLDRLTCEWENAAAVTRVDLIAAGNFIAGSRARLYGVY